MRLLRRCLHELWTLFVDEGVVAGWLVGWIAVTCLVLRQLPAGPWSGPVLFAGLLAIFMIGMRAGRR